MTECSGKRVPDQFSPKAVHLINFNKSQVFGNNKKQRNPATQKMMRQTFAFREK